MKTRKMKMRVTISVKEETRTLRVVCDTKKINIDVEQRATHLHQVLAHGSKRKRSKKDKKMSRDRSRSKVK